MRNRAKCKLCNVIIESLHDQDLQLCNCGEIQIEGGTKFYKAAARNWINFLRVDDQGNEIVVNVVDNREEARLEPISKPSKAEKLEMLQSMYKNIENLPPAAMSLPINHYDFYSALILMHEILKES